MCCNCNTDRYKSPDTAIYSSEKIKCLKQHSGVLHFPGSNANASEHRQRTLMRLRIPSVYNRVLKVTALPRIVDSRVFGVVLTETEVAEVH